MKIRSHFAILAATVLAIPVALLLIAGLLWTLTRGVEPLPSYDQLPQGADVFTDQATWERVRNLVGGRPEKSDTYVFDRDFRLIYGTAPLGPVKSPGDSLTLQESIQFVQGGSPRDILLLQPAGTEVWIVLVQGIPAPSAEAGQKVMWVLSVGLLVVLVISIALALIMGRALATSVVQLEQAARRIARGDLTSKVEALPGNDEIRSLGRALETMRQALREEEARQSRFVMGVSHDLKSPLALVKGYVELLKDGPASPETRSNHFDLILDKVDQLDGMIDHLIDYSKVNTGDWQLTWKPLVLKPFLEEFCRSVTPDARLLGRTLVQDLSFGEAWVVACDERSVRRCLENLVQNALRYTQEGGTVGVRAREEDSDLVIEVWDDGPGLAAEDLPHLFDAFYRGTHSRRESGMGLGLSIVKTILDSHGWSIRAESRQGARFQIRIPQGLRSG